MSKESERFRDTVLQRAAELNRRTDAALAKAGGPSTTTMTKLRKGSYSSPRDDTMSKFDQALDWVPGSAWKVWEGGEPIPLIDTRIRDNREAGQFLDDLAHAAGDAAKTSFRELQEAFDGGDPFAAIDHLPATSRQEREAMKGMLRGLRGEAGPDEGVRESARRAPKGA